MPNSAISVFSSQAYLWAGAISAVREWPVRAWAASEKPQLPLLLPIAFATGIGLWFALPFREYWLAAVCLMVLSGLVCFFAGQFSSSYIVRLRWAAACLLMVAAGIIVIWGKSLLVGATPLEKPWIGVMEGEIEAIEAQPARGRLRLYIAPKAEQNLPARIRLNVDINKAADFSKALKAGQGIKARVRLMPPGGPVIPGGYDFAQRAWFQGLGATGTLLDEPRILSDVEPGLGASNWRGRLAAHVQSQLPGSAGGIAATLATGDRGGLSETDAEAMRRSGLAHLLALSGLHVSAVIGAVFLIVVKLLALSPNLALRYRLPVSAAIAGAVAGICYTVFTGAEIPTVRACIAALLIVAALILGRDPISLRLVGFAAFVVLLIWPEALIGPSFQMSFAAVIAIVALYDTPLMRRLSLTRDEGGFALLPKIGRFIFMLFITGLVIEITLIPIALYHFNKAGLYGALANLIAIPLTTFVIMPLEALALLGDIVGIGAPFWWLCGKALNLLLALANFVSATPGSNILFSTMPIAVFLLFIIAGLLLFCLRSPLRGLAALPAMLAIIIFATTAAPDIIVAGDGRQFAVRNEEGKFLLLRPQSESFATDMIREEAGFGQESLDLKTWDKTQCSPDFCTFTILGKSRSWVIMAGISNNYVPLRDLAAACARSDIVIAPRRLPYLCKPKWQKVDRPYLQENGGIFIHLDQQKVISSEHKTDHGWRK